MGGEKNLKEKKENHENSPHASGWTIITHKQMVFLLRLLPVLFLLSVSQYHTDDRHGSGAEKK